MRNPSLFDLSFSYEAFAGFKVRASFKEFWIDDIGLTTAEPLH